MLRKIVHVRNVGRLLKVDAAGDVELRPMTLVFAENARGKTTLCDILRSVKTGDPNWILGRHALSTQDAAEVELLFDNRLSRFRSNKWDYIHPELEIFDSTFVNENVYSGDYVDHEHKRNLYRVIVGKEGVRLARRVDRIDAGMREIDHVIAPNRREVAALLPEMVSLDDFLGFEKVGNIDEQIKASKSEVAALQRSAEIAAKSELKIVDLPELPTNLEEILTRQLEGISSDAEQKVREHLSSHTINANEEWLSQGVKYTKEDKCPFCEQRIDGLDLISAYRAYFSEEYRMFKSAVESCRDQVERFGNEASLLRVKHVLEQNMDLAEFWEQFITFKKPTVQLECVEKATQELSKTTLAAIEQKLSTLLESVKPNHEFLESQRAFGKIKQEVVEYNKAIAVTNTLIRNKKSDIELGDLKDAQKKLSRLEAIKTRHEEKGISVCEKYQNSLERKKLLEEKKVTAKQALDDYGTEILASFETRINEILGLFGASFRIGATTRQYLGGRPSSIYQIVIDEVGVGLGDQNTAVGMPCFRNTLSAGDRSTLALAFFIARAELDPNIDRKILIFDDPFCSQDRFRRTCTQQLICRLYERCKQIILLSHEPRFLRSCWEVIERSKTRALQITRIGEQNSSINPWNIEDETSSEYFQKIFELKKFAEKSVGDPRHIAQTIRPVLEEYLKFNWPSSFRENEWLGDFLQKMELAVKGELLFALKGILSELEDINNFSKRYHHATNRGADTEPIDNGELTSFVIRTLQLIGAI